MLDKITNESVCLRAFSELKKIGVNQSDAGVSRLVWNPEGCLSMSFDSSWGESFRAPVRKFAFYGDKFYVESNNSQYEVSCHEPTGLWKGPVPGTVSLGYFKGWFLDSTLDDLGEPTGSEASLEIVADEGSNDNLFAILSINGHSWPLRKLVCFGSERRKYYYMLTVYTSRNRYRMVLKGA